MRLVMFSIGSFSVYSYGLLIAVGILLCTFLGTHRAKKRGMSEDAAVDLILLCAVFGFLGAKLLYVLVEFDTFRKDPLSVLGSEGFVVYGGIIAGILALLFYCRRKGLKFWEYFDLLIPGVSLAQGFGRIGCFFAGCCYGRPTDSWLGVTFPEGGLAPAGVKLLPTQLFSAAGDFLLCAVLLWYGRKRRPAGNVGAMYLLLYGIGRFLIEFLRSDDRGTIGALSTSQGISIAAVFAAVLFFIGNRKRERSRTTRREYGEE